MNTVMKKYNYNLELGGFVTFKREVQMYPIIRDWLLGREKDPCFSVVIDKPKKNGYYFNFGTKRYYGQLGYRYAGPYMSKTILR